LEQQGHHRVCRPAPRPEEEFARVSIQQALGVPVCWYDDGSRSKPGLGMYDLAIRYLGRPDVPVAVSIDVDRAAMATQGTLRDFSDGVWPAPGLARGWGLHTTAAPPLKKLYANVRACLAVLEAGGVAAFDAATHHTRRIPQLMGIITKPDPVLEAEATLLGMGVHAGSSYEPGPDGPTISLYLDRGQWSWDGSAHAAVTWINRFMADPIREDNLRQLASAAHSEAHLAVFADISSDGNVWRALCDETRTGVVPLAAPTLVPPVTHLWLFANPPGRFGLAWNPHDGWYRFPCVSSDEGHSQELRGGI
jgi:hypothetical protein